MKRKPLLVLALTLATTALFFQNCGRQFVADATGSDDFASNGWLTFFSTGISASPQPFGKWIFPAYSLLPMTEAGSDHESMSQKRRTDISSRFQAPIAFFKSKALNVYNPNVLKVPDSQYPFRMYFFGWAKEACNTHLPYHPEHNLAVKKNENWCDSIFVARAPAVTGPWQVLEEDSVFRPNLQNPERWKPILYSNGRNKVWDYHHTGDPSVILVNGVYFMAYTVTGHDVDEKGEWDASDVDSDFSSVAGAYSHDGVNWVKLAQPLLVSEKEAGFAPKSTPGLQQTNVNYARPSLMYDEGKFKLWFDYWLQGFPAMGYAELSGNPSVSVFSSGPWTIRQGDDKPAIRNWINPAVIKTPAGYFSYSDALLSMPSDTEGDTWQPRRLHEAFSPDGLTWTLTGHLPHLPNCLGHAPEALLLNGEIHLLYHCVGNSPDKDTMYLRKRKDFAVGSTPLPPVCQPGAKKSCSIPNGAGESVCNAAGTGYGSCTVTSCSGGYVKSSNSCVPQDCQSSPAKPYITTSLTYFRDAQTIPSVAPLARQCHGQITQALAELDRSKWECTKTDAAVATVRTCVDQIEKTLKECRTPETAKEYLRTAVIYLEGAVKIPKVANQAQICLRDLKEGLSFLEKNNWPCPQAEPTLTHIVTCIEKVIKPNLGQ